MNAEQVVNEFVAAIGRKDMDAAMALVAEDVYSDNVPLGDMRGRDKMWEFLLPFVNSICLDYFDNGMFLKALNGE